MRKMIDDEELKDVSLLKVADNESLKYDIYSKKKEKELNMNVPDISHIQE